MPVSAMAICMTDIRFTTRTGVDIAADAAGPADGPAVLFLHGGGQTRHSWGNAVSVLADRGFRAITMDLRGHGDSGWCPDANYELHANAADLVDVIGQLDDPTPTLVGASLGGITSLLAVGESSSPVARALVLVDVVPKIEMEGAQEIIGFMAARPDGFESLDEAAEVIAAYLPHRKRTRNIDGLRKNLRERDGRFYWHWDPRLLNSLGNGLSEDGKRDFLETAACKITIPTLLIKGGKSRIVSADGVRAFQTLIPHAEFVNVEEADHMVAGDANDAFNAPLLDFLSRFGR
jgi:pimeloyl-ACP methyl ester carboxylesterase